uniref:Uncharacterized protein n=1 Tax=Oryza meridionalis TaxID=40149 RepID=A0A0E0EXL5_9ORYZ
MATLPIFSHRNPRREGVATGCFPTSSLLAIVDKEDEQQSGGERGVAVGRWRPWNGRIPME